MKKGFTLIELIVAISLLAMVLFFSSTVFKVSIDSYRTAVANAEIMQKFRAITDQLNADFKSVQKSPDYNKVSFEMAKSDIGDGDMNVRNDRIILVSAGNFQSSIQYNDKTVSGNVACIFYGLAETNSEDPLDKILLRRQTILVPENAPSGDSLTGEFYDISFSEWNKEYTDTVGNQLMDRPEMDITKSADLPMYMARGVDDFTIKFAKWDGGSDQFEWRPENHEVSSYNNKRIATNAFKFSFTLYDSKGVITNGRRFTHIVYIGD